jgi:hypothetical protein
VGILAPFAPINFGPDGTVEDEQGKMLSVAPESTRNDSLLRLSFKNNNLEPCEKDTAVADFTMLCVALLAFTDDSTCYDDSMFTSDMLLSHYSTL